MPACNLPQRGRLLIFFPSGIGDVIRNLGIVNAIKSARPGLTIDVAYVKAGTEIFLKYNTSINDTVRLHLNSYTINNYLGYFLSQGWRDVRVLRRRKYDLMLATTLNPLRRFLLAFAGAHRKLTLSDSGSNSFNEYRLLDSLGIPPVNRPFFDDTERIDAIDPRPQVRRAIDLARPNILLNMFCADSPGSIRDWDKWAELIDQLHSKVNVILIGRADFPYQSVYPLAYDKTIDLINQTSIEDLIYLVVRANVVITIDSMPFHLSYALNKATIGLFGPVDPQTRIPPHLDNKNIITIYHRAICTACITTKQINYCRNPNNSRVCMKIISVDDILQALKRQGVLI